MNSPLQRMGRDSSRRKRDGAAVLSAQADPFARAKGEERRRPAPFGMTGWGWGVRGTQASRPGLNCDAPPALEGGWRDELAATKEAEGFIPQNARDGAAVLPARPGAQK